MNNPDCPGAWGDAPLDIGRVKIVGLRIHLGEDWRCSCISDGICSGDEAQRRHDHLIPVPDVENEQGHMQRGRAATTSHSVLSAYIICHNTLKLRHSRSLSEPAAFDDFTDAIHFISTHYSF